MLNSSVKILRTDTYSDLIRKKDIKSLKSYFFPLINQLPLVSGALGMVPTKLIGESSTVGLKKKQTETDIYISFHVAISDVAN